MIKLQYQEYECTEVDRYAYGTGEDETELIFTNTLELEFETLEELSEFLQDTIVKIVSISQNT